MFVVGATLQVHGVEGESLDDRQKSRSRSCLDRLVGRLVILLLRVAPVSS